MYVVLTINRKPYMASPMALIWSNLILTDLQRSKSRSLRFSVVGYLSGIDIFASSNITTIWMSQEGVCWRAGFPLSQRFSCWIYQFFYHVNDPFPSMMCQQQQDNFSGSRFSAFHDLKDPTSRCATQNRLAMRGLCRNCDSSQCIDRQKIIYASICIRWKKSNLWTHKWATE